MSRLLRHPTADHGKVHDITPESAGWGYVGFGLYRLAPGETVAEPTGATEVILVLVEGKARIGAGGRGVGEVGGRIVGME
jgi:5-deoxy-glucuronate isomerase